ncbi:PalA [Haloferax sp. BAB-2207]|nr:PalA [Haloferax sp. BAB-2207]
MPTRVTVWNENVHEREEPAVAERYPTGIHGTIAAHLEGPDREVRTATLQEPEHGLDEATLDATDVLVWWSHCANDEVTDAVAERVVDRVHEGMGFIPLHSGKNSKPFTRLMGTTCNIKYRHGGERERVWVADPATPSLTASTSSSSSRRRRRTASPTTSLNPIEPSSSRGSKAATCSARASATAAVADESSPSDRATRSIPSSTKTRSNASSTTPSSGRRRPRARRRGGGRPTRSNTSRSERSGARRRGDCSPLKNDDHNCC